MLCLITLTTLNCCSCCLCFLCAGEMFPEHVGFPLGEGGATYLMMEMHYDNPNLRQGKQSLSVPRHIMSKLKLLHECDCWDGTCFFHQVWWTALGFVCSTQMNWDNTMLEQSYLVMVFHPCISFLPFRSGSPQGIVTLPAQVRYVILIHLIVSGNDILKIMMTKLT